MLAASNMSRITLLKSSFSFGVSSHLVRGSLSFTSSSASIFSLFGFICVRQGSFQLLSTHQQVLGQITQPKQLYVESMRFKGGVFFLFPYRENPELIGVGISLA